MRKKDPEYMRFVRTQPCAMRVHDPCEGPIEAHHAGRDRGLGQKAADDTCVPLCQKHHMDWHGASGPFKTMRRDERRQWADTQILMMQDRRVQDQFSHDRWF